MKKYLLALLMLGSLFPDLQGQGQIPDGDFENWSNGGAGFYEQPASGWWASLNPLRDIGGPVTLEKSTDAHSGNYSALITTKQFGTLLVPGVLVSGTFNLLAAPNYFTRGRPYTGRPSSFSGWYKYLPVNGDSAGIGMQLTRWDAAQGKRDTVGEAGIVLYLAANGWTQYAIPIFYYSQDQPDTLIVAATPSFAGANFIGQVGSQLWIDDLDMDVASAAADPSAALQLQFAETATEWRLDAGPERGMLEVLDLAGKQLLSQPIHPGPNAIPKANLPQGILLLRFNSEKGGHWFRKAPLFH